MMVETKFRKFFPVPHHQHHAPPHHDSITPTMSTTTAVIDRDTLYTIIDMWSAEYHLALRDRSTYGSKHRGYYQDARKICRQIRAADIEGTIFDYINDVLRDASKRGYDDELHYPGLKKGYLAWTRGDQPVPNWNPAGGIPPLPEIPPIRSSKEVCKQSPAIDLLEKALEELEAAKPEGKEEDMAEEEDEVREPRSTDTKAKQKAKENTRDPKTEPTARAEPSKSGRGKAGRVKSAAVVKDDDDDNADADADGEPDTNDPPCTRCNRVGVPCEIKGEVKGVRAMVACVPCKKAKSACSLSKGKITGKVKETSTKAGSSAIEDVPQTPEASNQDIPTTEPPKRRRRPAPKVIATGLAGDFSSKCRTSSTSSMGH